MYSFIDTTDQTGAAVLPAEAISYNGEYLDEVIEGFRTLYVSGRESLDREVKEQTIPGVIGSRYSQSLYGTRDIEVGYQLLCQTPEKFRQAYNLLNTKLAKEQVRVIFNDEKDKYFIGTATNTGDPDPGRLCVTGVIRIHCSDPLKYSTVERRAVISPLSVNTHTFMATIKNDGSVPVPIRYELSMTDESGYIGISSQSGAMEFGHLDEVDGVYDQRDEQLLTWSDFQASEADENSRHGVKTATSKGADWLMPDFSVNADTHTPGAWCHVVKTFYVPNTSPGTEVFDFEAKGQIWFECGDTSQIGELIVELIGEADSQERSICRLAFSKGTAQLSADIYMHVDGALKAQERFTPASWSSYSGPDKGFIAIRKGGDTVTFYPKGAQQPFSYTVDGLRNIPLKKIRIYFGHRDGSAPVTSCFVRGLSLLARNVNGVFDVRNTFFPAGQTLRVTVDGNSSRLFLNGTAAPELEVLGSQYFPSEPGTTTVTVGLSSWFKGGLSGEAIIREAWL